MAGVTWSQVPSLHSQIPRGAGPYASATAHLARGHLERGRDGGPGVGQAWVQQRGGGHSTSIQMA